MARSSVPQVETSRTLLREATIDDLDEWASRVFADPEVVRYMPKRDLTPRARAERAYGVYSRLWAERPYGGWLITDKAGGELIGSCELEHLPDAGEVELGYALAKRYWGKGLASEVARAVTRFGFESANLERIMAVVVPENAASWRVLEKAGFAFEKNARYYDLDVAYYAITRERFSRDDSFYKVHLPRQ